MNTTPYIVLSAVMGAAAVLLHFGSVFLDGRIGALSYFINLAVHLSLFVSLFLSGADFDMLVLVFMISVCLYVSIYFVRYRIMATGKNEREKEDER